MNEWELPLETQRLSNKTLSPKNNRREIRGKWRYAHISCPWQLPLVSRHSSNLWFSLKLQCYFHSTKFWPPKIRANPCPLASFLSSSSRAWLSIEHGDRWLWFLLWPLSFQAIACVRAGPLPKRLLASVPRLSELVPPPLQSFHECRLQREVKRPHSFQKRSDFFYRLLQVCNHIQVRAQHFERLLVQLSDRTITWRDSLYLPSSSHFLPDAFPVHLL